MFKMKHTQVADVCENGFVQGLALAHNAAGDLPAARAAFRKAVKLEPEHAPSWQACACWVPTLGGYPVKLLSWGSLQRCASRCAGAGARPVGAGMGVLGQCRAIGIMGDYFGRAAVLALNQTKQERQ